MTIYQWISEAAYLERSELIIHSTVLAVMSCGMTGFHFSIQYARRGQILFTRLRRRKIATRSLYRWHMLYNSYGASSPEPFQKLGQSLKVSRRVANS